MKPWFRVCKVCSKAYRKGLKCPYCGYRNYKKTYGSMLEYVEKFPNEPSGEDFFK